MMEQTITQDPGFVIKYDKNGQPLRHSDPEFAKKAQQIVLPDVEQTQHLESSEPTQDAAPEVETDGNQLTVEQEQVEEILETPTSKKFKPIENNIKELREKAERAQSEAERIKRERDEMAAYIQQMRAQQEQPHIHDDEIEEDYSINLKDDDLVEGKEIAKLVKKINNLESKLKKSQQQSSQMSVETRLKMQYPDIEKVLSQENLMRLKNEEPELAYTISMNPDLYSQSVTAYKQIKKLGIVQDQPIQNYETEKQIIQKNISKPRPVVSINAQQGDSPLSRANAFANGLTEDLKKQLQREMAEIRKAY